MTLVASALAGGDCIDDADALRAGGTAGALGCVVKAPSTLVLQSRLWSRGLKASPVMTLHGTGLVAPSPA